MISLSQETEALARKVADARRVPVETAIRDALVAAAQGSAPVDPRRKRDASPEAVARRCASMRQIADELAAMPVLDNRPLQEIIDDINAV